MFEGDSPTVGRENNVKKTIVCLKTLCYICVTDKLQNVTFVTFCFLMFSIDYEL